MDPDDVLRRMLDTWRDELVDELALEFAKQRTHGNVYMDGTHNPTPMEKVTAERFMEMATFVLLQVFRQYLEYNDVPSAGTSTPTTKTTSPSVTLTTRSWGTDTSTSNE